MKNVGYIKFIQKFTKFFGKIFQMLSISLISVGFYGIIKEYDPLSRQEKIILYHDDIEISKQNNCIIKIPHNKINHQKYSIGEIKLFQLAKEHPFLTECDSNNTEGLISDYFAIDFQIRQRYAIRDALKERLSDFDFLISKSNKQDPDEIIITKHTLFSHIYENFKFRLEPMENNIVMLFDEERILSGSRELEKLVEEYTCVTQKNILASQLISTFQSLHALKLSLPLLLKTFTPLKI